MPLMEAIPTVSTATLIAQLATQDVRHLRLTRTVEPMSNFSPETLITDLARHPDARLREALILLFLRQPTYARYVPEITVALESEAALTLRHMYTAAVYLQRLWRSTLGLYLGSFLLLPDYFGQAEFCLPAPDLHFGEAGLRALAALFQAKTGYDWLTTYHSAISLLLAQLSLEMTPDD